MGVELQPPILFAGSVCSLNTLDIICNLWMKRNSGGRFPPPDIHLSGQHQTISIQTTKHKKFQNSLLDFKLFFRFSCYIGSLELRNCLLVPLVWLNLRWGGGGTKYLMWHADSYEKDKACVEISGYKTFFQTCCQVQFIPLNTLCIVAKQPKLDQC
jgi:hypothetical protein